MDETFITREMPSVERASSGMAWNSAGYPMAPVAMIAPCPGMRRGADAVVPIVPGFVSVMDVPANASGSIVPFRAFATMPSKASRNSPKDSASAPLMFGTRRLREPSFFVMSIAMPRFTAALRMRAGFPSGLAVRVVHPRVLLESAHDRPRDEVREGDLREAQRLAVPVQDAPVLLHRLDGDDAVRDGGRNAERRLHVPRDRGGAAGDRDGLLAGTRRGR